MFLPVADTSCDGCALGALPVIVAAPCALLCPAAVAGVRRVVPSRSPGVSCCDVPSSCRAPAPFLSMANNLRGGGAILPVMVLVRGVLVVTQSLFDDEESGEEVFSHLEMGNTSRPRYFISPTGRTTRSPAIAFYTTANRQNSPLQQFRQRHRQQARQTGRQLGSLVSRAQEIGGYNSGGGGYLHCNLGRTFRRRATTSGEVWCELKKSPFPPKRMRGETQDIIRRHLRRNHDYMLSPCVGRRSGLIRAQAKSSFCACSFPKPFWETFGVAGFCKQDF